MADVSGLGLSRRELLAIGVAGAAVACSGNSEGATATPPSPAPNPSTTLPTTSTTIPEAGVRFSSLWGEQGERFDARGRLMDWSYAGYRAGEAALPEPAVVATVGEHGAVGDGETDDGPAFAAALAAAAATGGAVRVEPGRYLLRQRLMLPSGVALVGGGPDRTTMFFPEPLEALYPGEKDWSFDGGFIESAGSRDAPTLASIVAEAERGDDVIVVADAGRLDVGQWILIQQTDVDGELLRALHADLAEGGEDNVGDVAMQLPTRVLAVDGDTVTLERALPVRIRPEWHPEVLAVAPEVSEVGVVGLTIEFAHTPYPGHFEEEGFNAIAFTNVWHGYVSDVRIVNADYGVKLTRCFFCTVDRVQLQESESRGEAAGHHALNSSFGGDNVFSLFSIDGRFLHDLSIDWYTRGVVFSGGRGVDLALDHHRGATSHTLWTDLDIGAATRPFLSGGRSDRGPRTGAYDTLWNVRADGELSLPTPDFGPAMSFVGVDTTDGLPDGHADWHLEAIPPDDVQPANLWHAMRRRRLGDGAD